jgi:DNA-binding NarL/FixJ family response regulator
LEEATVRGILDGLALQVSVARVLVVDDSQLWQKFIRTQLDGYPNATIVGMESDGLQAVRKAEELQPDLVLLDIHITTMSGIEAARQIRKVAPKAAILFVSGESDPDFVREAFRAGGHGYVLKHEAVMDLLAGMEAVLLGRPFKSRHLGDIADLA